MLLTKGQSDARYLPAMPEDGAFRISAAGFLQLKDSADDQFRSLFLESGALVTGPAED